jgi:hypothetical protein
MINNPEKLSKIVDTAHPQPFCHQPSLGHEQPPRQHPRPGKRDLLRH